MKRSLLTIFFSLALSFSASSETLFTTSSSPGGIAAGGYKGLIVTLSSSIYAQLTSDPVETLVSQDKVQLNSFTLSSSSNGAAGHYSGNVYMLVFEAGNSLDSSVANPLLGGSDVVNWGNDGSDYTFNFSSTLLLNPEKKYSFVFSTTSDSYTALPGITSALRLKVTDYSDREHDQGFYAYGSDSTVLTGRYIADITIKSSSVPEPGTVSLGTLGLASLILLRRKR